MFSRVGTHADGCLCVYAFMSVGTHVGECLVCMFSCVWAYVCVGACVCVHVFMYVGTHMCVGACVHMWRPEVDFRNHPSVFSHLIY